MSGADPLRGRPRGTDSGADDHRLPGPLRAAGASDLEAIETLLEASGLPSNGVGESLEHFFVCEDKGGALPGAVGLELYGAAGLLRSTLCPAGAVLMRRALDN